ncbi:MULTISPECIES: adenylosuccinate lyase [unclassified Gemella]|uniref:adenylosuccinate lyase n=1 Tax=unclassified Gemella TaxID=2624949 RepID=UPI001C059BBE|nr:MULTISPECIES: adenylosuccinate lyase [unclassified Gemella]MBU0278356.1 adenylosuccinate lyase [Gemella sp. zg-1178]QWQ39489.1 adenylosuccinate lyase [Gemella sp. zg-570]
MIERYSTKEMQEIWSEENKFKAWLEVEILACEGWSHLGQIPKEDVATLREKASFDINRIYEIERETRHDVIAFTRAASETLGQEKKWVHYGLTSTDVVDTAYGYLYKQANEIIRTKIIKLIEVLKEKSYQYKNTFMMGRTHGVHAEITTFGLKMALWYEEMNRNLERFNIAAKQVEAGKISGAVGTYANIPTYIQDYVCEKLGINSSKISTQVLQRDRHAHYYSTLALIASSIEKFSVEIRHLQRTEVREVEEFFRKGQKGSSAMPHKRNPISSENMSGLARVLRGYMLTSFENIALWHERDISHSSAERIISADATNLMDYQLTRFINTISNLTVFEENMAENINKTYGVIFSQRIMLKLIEKGVSRESAYDLVQPKAMHAWENKILFKDLLIKDNEIMSYLSSEELEDCFNYKYHISSLEEIYARVFG